MLTFIYTHIILLFMVLCVLLKRNTNFILNLGKFSHPRRETVLRVHGMKSDEKLLFCQTYAFSEKK